MVETVGELLQKPAKGYFLTVHVAGEVEGEVERSFYEEFRAELGSVWHLYDSSGFRLHVEFDNDDDVPRIRAGWMTIRRQYNFEGHHPILFKYLGNNQFQIIPKEDKITPDKFPTWHTKSRALRKAVTFEITMTEDPEIVPYLTLPKKMGKYLWNTMLDEINIIGTIREKHKCELTYQKDPFLVTISRGWPEVVGINGYKVGDRLLFNTSSIYEDHCFFVTNLNSHS